MLFNHKRSLKKMILGILCLLSSIAYGYELGPVAIHGYIGQGFIYTDGNNYLTKDSQNIGSFDFTEAAINFNYQPFNRVTLSSQLISRNIGDANFNEEDLALDYAQLNFNLFSSDNFEANIRLGQQKPPFGIYFDMADLPSFRPDPLYGQTNRSYLMRARGYCFDFSFYNDFGNFSFEFGSLKGYTNKEDFGVEDFKVYSTPMGRIKWSSPSMEWQAGYSYAKLKMDYVTPLPTFPQYDRYDITIHSNIFEEAFIAYTNPKWGIEFSIYELGRHETYDLIGANNISFQEFNFKFPSRGAQIGFKYLALKDINFSVHYTKDIYNTDIKDVYRDYRRPDIKYSLKQWKFVSDFYFTPNLLLKSSLSINEGGYGISSGLNPDPSEWDNYWTVFATELSWQF